MKILTKEDAYLLLGDVIKNKLRHRDYPRVTQMADTLEKLITGENMDSLMRRFDQREDKDQFAQRKRITQHITSTVSKNLMKPAYKIPRSNGTRRILKYTDDVENQKLDEFEGILDKFWGDRSLDDYMGDRWIELSYSDPNSFIVYEWQAFDHNTEHAEPYPFEVSAHEAIYYMFDNNILRFLVVMNEFEKGAGGIPEKVQDENDGKAVTKRYTIYYKGGSIVFDQLDKEEVDKLRPGVLPTEGKRKGDYVNISQDIFRVHEYDSGLDFIPVVRVGYRSDLATRGRTCISPIEEAVPILMKTIKANSELDLTMAMHAFPLKAQYSPECEAEGCNKGRLPTGELCGTCNGSGIKPVTTTSQEFINMKMPRDKEEFVDLTGIVTYITPSVELIRFQDEYIKSLTAQCKEAIYNSDIFSRQEIAETATGKNIDLDNVYDSLYTPAKAFAFTWKFSVRAIADITDMMENLVYDYIINRDFKMKSLSNLYLDLKTVSDSKAPAFIKQGIYDDIARYMYTDDPHGYSRYRTKQHFYPYTGKSDEAVASIISTISPLDFYRVLWESYAWIFEELERRYAQRGADFYDLSRSAQWTQIEKEVIKQIERKKKDQPPTPNFTEEVIGE